MEIAIDAELGLVSSARQCPSENCDDRPDTPVDLIVIHGISLPPGQFGGHYIDALFCNALDPQADEYFPSITGLKVSSHLLIRRDGQLVQYVPFHRRAWHAGVSTYLGRANCNDYSIGIELEGTDYIPYTAAQYEALASSCCALLATYPDLRPQRIAGHCDISPGRKTDPGPAFNWSHFYGLLDRYLDQPMRKT